jgi:hypothetical protein
MDSGLFHLCDGLKNPSCQLETLCLWNNQITAVAMAPLTEALLENKTLSMLNLGQNAIMDQGTASWFHHFFFIGRSKQNREKVRVRWKWVFKEIRRCGDLALSDASCRIAA